MINMLSNKKDAEDAYIFTLFVENVIRSEEPWKVTFACDNRHKVIKDIKMKAETSDWKKNVHVLVSR